MAIKEVCEAIRRNLTANNANDLKHRFFWLSQTLALSSSLHDIIVFQKPHPSPCPLPRMKSSLSRWLTEQNLGAIPRSYYTFIEKGNAGTSKDWIHLSTKYELKPSGPAQSGSTTTGLEGAHSSSRKGSKMLIFCLFQCISGIFPLYFGNQDEASHSVSGGNCSGFEGCLQWVWRVPAACLESISSVLEGTSSGSERYSQRVWEFSRGSGGYLHHA